MVAEVTVPMNFGRHLLNSPTHSNITLRTSEGGEVRASSVIMSFNSPVIGHMTGDLHMTSVDLLEFSREAVGLFVDAAYSGTAENITREIFRDLNKISHVFEVTWLAEKCLEFFKDLAESVTTPSYPDLVYLFDEGAFLYDNLKKRELCDMAIWKIGQVKYKGEFIERYLQNAGRLSTKKLDLVVELAGNDVTCIVETLTKQLTEQIHTEGWVLPSPTKYLLDSADLYLCKLSDEDLLENLFTTIRDFPDVDTVRWGFDLMRKSQQENPQSLSHSCCSTNLLRCDVIKNLYYDFNENMSNEELVQWMIASEEVNSLLLAFEAFYAWFLYRRFICKDQQISESQFNNMFDGISQISEQQGWLRLPSALRSVQSAWCNTMSRICVGDNENCAYTVLDSTEDCNDSLFLLSKDSTLVFNFKHPDVLSCDIPGRCGFILKSVPCETEGVLWTLRLCTESEDYYNQQVHFHKEVRAEKMHVFCVRKSGNFLIPISWLGWVKRLTDLHEWQKIWSDVGGGRYVGCYEVLYEI